jgi:Flp pilus assembly protein TadD
MVDESTVPAGDQKLHFHLLNGIIYSMHDWQHLAVLEIDKVPEGDRGDSNELLAGAHMAIAYFHLRSKDYEAADREIVRSMQIAPNNPVSIFLTGERLAANGEYEKAADSMEDLVRDPDQKWLAKRVSARARELRDSPAEG